MKAKIDRDEWWPVYDIDDYGKECEVPDDLIERHQKVMAEFAAVQRELEAIFDGTG